MPQDDRILDPGAVVPGQHRPGRPGIEPGGVGGLEEIDPPVEAARSGAAHVQPPPAPGHGHQGRALQGLAVEVPAVELGQGVEPFTVLGPGHHVDESPGLPRTAAGSGSQVDGPVLAHATALGPPAQCPGPLPEGSWTMVARGRVRYRDEVRFLRYLGSKSVADLRHGVR